MSILRITVFQKDISEPLDNLQIKNFTSQKSEFLVLPEYFYINKNIKSFDEVKNLTNKGLTWLTRLSELFKGIIIGGSFIFNKENETYIGIPVLKGGQIIDWQTKQKLTVAEKKFSKAGSGENMFILDRICFSVCFYSDIFQKNYFDKIKIQKVKLIFCLGSFEEKITKESISNELLELSKKHNINIILCTSFNKAFYFNGELGGYTQVVTPYGVSWKLSKEEEKKEILKTIMLNNPQLEL